MWIVCKRRKIESKIIKRKKFYDDFIDFPHTMKKHKIYHEFNNIKKQKCHKDLDCNRDIKKQKKCIFHEEKYICDIYECSGVQKYYHCNHMPYII